MLHSPAVMVPAIRPSLARFGKFRCDLVTGDLWKDDRRCRLQDQPRQILLALLQRPGELVSRDDLRRRLWDGATFVDFDNALNVGIRKIRDALGDDAPAARYVETVRGHGYRFIAPVAYELRPDPPREADPVVAPARRDTPARAETAWARPSYAIASLLVVAVVALVTAQARRPAAGIKSIAVLPFANLLEDKEREYLVDGLTHSITSELADRLPLRVIASQSAFVFKETKQDRRTIGHALGADVLLVGNVAQAGAAIAINARLVDTATDRTLWTGRFERSLDDMTSADLIVEAIAQGVGTLADTRPHARASRTILPEARDAFLRGRFFWAKRGEANAAIAVRYLSTAVQLQPDYAEAWAGLADVYAVNTGSPSPVIVPWPGDGIRAGEIAAREALRLSPRLGEAHAALGKLYVAQRRWLEAEQSFQRAIEFAPQYSTGRQWYGTMFLRLGRCDEAREQVELGARLDPLAVLVNEAVGSVFWNCGEPQRAIEQYEAVLRMHPDAASTRLLLARALTDAERFDDAIAVLDALGAGGESTISALACAYARSGRGDDARALLPRVSQPFLRASIFAALGDADAMWNALEQALTNAGGLQNLIVDRNFWPYRHAPRFLEFARRAGFPVPPMPIARFSRPLGNPDVRARRN